MPDLHSAVYDNFLAPEAAAMLRRFAIQQSYGPEDHDGIAYHGVGKDPGLVGPEKLAATIGAPAVKIAASFFRFGPPVPETNSYIHCDNSMMGSHAAVLHLSDPPLPGGYGTAFWTHRERGWSFIPNPEVVANLAAACVSSPGEEQAMALSSLCPRKGIMRLGYSTEWLNRFYASLNEDGLHEDRWALNGLVGMKFNRLLVYPTCLFHSRYPRQLTGFGDTPATGRLIWGCFFSPSPA